MIRQISFSDYRDNYSGTVPLADVRTPAEFAHGHIPGACNLPIFSNEERIQVGTTYKQQGREQAILLGFDLCGPKWSGFIRQALELAPGKKIALHCWRGGMRSGAMAWALDLYGFEVWVLKGGYKQYRSGVHDLFATPFPLLLLGGMTGSGKTRLLQELHRRGEQMIDLEDLAQHQGSAYGSMDRLQQPTQEQFENQLARQLHTLDTSRRIWVEDESFSIGSCRIPYPFWQQMKTAALVAVSVAQEDRVAALAAEYGSLDPEFLVACTERIHKRLGPEQTRHAITAIREGRMADFIRQVLIYYDKAYRSGLAQRGDQNIRHIELDGRNDQQNAGLLLSLADRDGSAV